MLDNENTENICGTLAWIQAFIMQGASFLHVFFSLLAFWYFVITTMANLSFGRDPVNIEAAEERKSQRQLPRTVRDATGTMASKRPQCGATAIRLNLDLNRLHGKWYPIEASSTAYILWMTSLYGKDTGTKMVDSGCLSMELKPGSEEKTLDVELKHADKSAQVQAALLGDAFHPGTSKWVISWPNGEDTLTSIVATGTGKDSHYEWMLNVDCDLNENAYPDWAIFSRDGGLSDETLGAIKAIVDGIAGLRTNKTRKIDKASCSLN